MDQRPSSPSSPDEFAPVSRRQRLLGLARATRDTYIPKISSSVSSIASGYSRALNNNPTVDVYDEEGRLILPSGTTIHLFPSYTRYQDGTYYIDVKGWVSCPGLMTRKNRLILSLAKQITKYNNNNTTQALNQWQSESIKQDILNSDGSDTESVISEGSNTSGELQPASPVSSNGSTTEDLIKERLACFIARSIPNSEILIVIGSVESIDVEDIVTQTVFTDNNGHFETTLEVTYKPSVVQAKSANTETIFAFQDVLLLPNGGIGIISDIDDTIKLTGVIGDKRELMTNLLLNEVSSWNIPNVINWYHEMHKHSLVSFHYVSNSPWQLFSTISQYFKAVNLPPGSVHLKQYTGNIISSLMEPSSSRKKRALYKILNDFPEKKFICVGDSGEYDLEAYADLAKSYPGRVASINIRYVTNSFSDVDDQKIFTELKRLLNSNTRHGVVTNLEVASVSSEHMTDLIDLSDEVKPRKLPPLVPKKPTSLKGNAVERKPPLPNRPLQHAQTDSLLVVHPSSPPSSSNIGSDGNSIDLSDSPPPILPRRPGHSYTEGATHDEISSIMESPSFYELEEMDKKGATWIRRIITAMYDLEESGTRINLFVDDDVQFFENNNLELVELLRKLNIK
ncbi:Phosphatidate phosphatase APP1 [Spathaspora sp. JA1]|nr:Phosphatidate phosphatase APP1 [Spathaspora sp. JA1]